MPNIYGYLSRVGIKEPQGAFKGHIWGGYTTSMNGEKSYHDAEFNASLWNKIYGSSDTVQPPAIKANIWIRKS